MKLKKLTAVTLTAAMALSCVACSSNDTTENKDGGDEIAKTGLSYSAIELGKDYTDISTTLKFITHRTDMLQDDYAGTSWSEYVAEFNKVYPNIKIEFEGITDYADEVPLRLTSEDWGDIMMIPTSVTKEDLSKYFVPYDTLEAMEKEIRYANVWSTNGYTYGVPSTANAQGVVYNKAVFEAAGITELPKTPDDFIAALQKIADNTDAIPLYTNYAAGWTMGAWDAYIFGVTGSATCANQEFLHASNPFSEGGVTAAYDVFSVLYNAVANGLIEDDYMTTDWEGSKGMINRGEIGCMVLGSWAFPQMVAAGENGDDIGYMAFPVTAADGKQYAPSGPDYNYGINVNASDDNKKAAMVFVKWMTEESGFSYNECGIPIAADDDKYPDMYQAFSDNGVEFVTDEPAIAGEEKFLDELNTESELSINADGGVRGQAMVVSAANGTETLEEILAEWDAQWTAAQEELEIEVK